MKSNRKSYHDFLENENQDRSASGSLAVCSVRSTNGRTHQFLKTFKQANVFAIPRFAGTAASEPIALQLVTLQC